MGKIVELSQQVANQIAAGEVVERPASVVKELVENSIDAGARNIEVRVKNGGFAYIVVQDDGLGMDEADVRLATRRYATSKLNSVSDLENLHTFGFRGEALPSIASISQMLITSRPDKHEHGTRAEIDAGVLVEISKAGAAFGTRIEVRDLFFNVPARLKFAKSKGVEASEIDRFLRAMAFAHPDIGFRCFIDDKLSFSCTSESSNALARAHLLLGEDQRYLYELRTDTELLSIHGVIGAPMVQRRDTRGMVFFVNNRLVSDKKLVIAIKTAFQSLIEVGFQPVCALKIAMAPDEVDVNVHPRKAEVRFRNDKEVVSQIIGELRKALAKTPWLSSGEELRAPIGTPRPIAGQSLYLFRSGRERSGFLQDLSSPPSSAAIKTPLLYAPDFSSLRAIGQISSTYLLLESEQGLVIVDQHAAHERVMYERLRDRHRVNLPTMLLLPIAIDLDLSSMALLESHASEIKALGIEAEKFG
ncbi:MAG TPA: DNA mismatch repair endonuclease MutL, partial [Myxococcota bacterium]|nr:DNA mismatch repair endonuclease MutL [Myxococcota bacterium]